MPRAPLSSAVRFESSLNPEGVASTDALLATGGRRVPLLFIRNLRARRYVLRLRPDGSARVTIPRGGSRAEAERFAERNKAWLERQLERLDARPRRAAEWLIGTELLFRGQPARIESGASGGIPSIRLATETIPVLDPAANLRPTVEHHLWTLAAIELPPMVFGFAARHQMPVRRVTVRNQKSRWGSCSRRGTISLNWRLIQTPRHVQEYIILHELCHLREMNHSGRFWREVERVCPDYVAAERWLKMSGSHLHI
jgi:predicted metal-dependent hydrolase